MHRGDVKCVAALVLNFDEFDHGVVFRDEIGDRVREIGRVRDADIAFDDGQSALFLGDNQVARMRRGTGFFAGRDKNQLNRLRHDDAGRDMNECAVEKESRVERRKSVIFHADVTAQVFFQQRGIRAEHGRETAGLHAFRQRAKR